MKKLVRFSVIVAALLLTFSGCELYNAINLAWTINSVTYSNSLTRVSYTATNLGKTDLTGVNLEIGVDVNGDGTYSRSAWTADFNINQGQSMSGIIDIYTGVMPNGWATVISVDMDNPKDKRVM
ncbi:MAG TPA: hypothetical protein VL354_15630 [Spirochaetia bacterium]|nr:hypothetical protein [Spirochaetia bacterium]